MLGTVYLIRNLKNGKGYVGSTRNSIEHRWRGHTKLASKGGGSVLGAAIRKHQATSFSIEVLQTYQCSQKELYERETFWMDKFSTRCPNGYNVIDGKGPNYGPEFSKRLLSGWAEKEGSRRQLSASIKASWKDPSIREDRSSAIKEAWSQPGVKEKMSATATELWNRPDMIAKRVKIVNSPETNLKLSLASIKSWSDPVAKAQRLASMHSEETRRKRGLAIKEGWARRRAKLGSR